MTDQANTPTPPTIEDLRKKRQVSAVKVLLHIIREHRQMKGEDRDLCTVNLAMDLSEEERGALIYTLIATFPADLAELVVQESFRGAGWPDPALMDNARSDARFWAQAANRKEIDAFAIECFQAMSKDRKSAFLQWAQAQK